MINQIDLFVTQLMKINYRQLIYQIHSFIPEFLMNHDKNNHNNIFDKMDMKSYDDIQMRQSMVSRFSMAGGMHNMQFVLQGDRNMQLFERKKDDQNEEGRQAQENDCDDENFNETIKVSSLFSWSILFINCIFSAFVPCWLMGDVRSESFTRNSWRYLTLSFLLLPFLLYEQRNIKDQKMKISNCLTKANLKPIYISTINFCIWLGLLINACRWTSMNHAVCLSGLRILMISLIKFKRGEKFHEFEVAGTMLSVIGVFLVLTDSITLPQVFDQSSEKYLRIEPWKRLILGDGIAILGSIASYYLDQNHKVPEMPRFTYLYIYNVFLTFNLITFGYFFGGNEFSFNVKYGVFGLYTYENFVRVFYVSVMLGLTLMLSNILINQIFSQLIINVTSCFQLIITAMIYHIIGLELIPSGMTCLGYSFLVPGMVFCVGGQGALQNLENKLNFEVFKPEPAPPRETNFNYSTESPKRFTKNLSFSKAEQQFMGTPGSRKNSILSVLPQISEQENYQDHKNDKKKNVKKE